jgi:hypothetical protein
LALNTPTHQEKNENDDESNVGLEIWNGLNK